MNIRKYNDIAVILIGVNHYDIFGREKLSNSLINIKNRYHPNKPILIGTEYPIDFYNDFQTRFQQFKDKCKEKFINTTSGVVDLLCKACMYEIDIAKKYFPNVKLVELRQNKNLSLDDWEKKRISIYERNLDCNAKNIDELRKLLITKYDIDSSRLANENNAFCGIYFNEIEKDYIKESYLISITGSNHLEQPSTDSMKEIFEYFGFSTECIYIDN